MRYMPRLSWTTLRERVNRLFTDRVILALGWLWFLVYCYPGFMSYDSVWQLSQARHIDKMNEWHPPMMAFIWRITDSFIAGPFPMLVLQSVSFLVGLYALLRRVMSPRAAAIAAVVMLLLPQNIIIMGVIWKDSQMAGYILASAACLLSPRLGWRLLGCFFLFLATGVRYNAAAATLPIALGLWTLHAQGSRLRRYGVATAIWVGVTVAAVVFSAQLVEEKKYPWQTAAAPIDIVGTIRFSPHLDNDQLLRDTEGVPWRYRDKIQIRARTWYKPEHSFLDITAGPNTQMEYIQTDEQRAAITRAWKNLVFAHPFAFLRHRLGVFGAQLDTVAGVWASFANADWGEDLLHHRATYSSVQLAWVHAMEAVAPTQLFRAVYYFWLAIALLPFCRRNRLAFVMLASGICHELGLFLVVPAIDYRYSQWMVLATLTGLLLVLVERVRGARVQRAP